MMIRRQKRQAGFGMIEVLVTIVILMIGLLGLAALQARSSVVEMEAYQRGQALALARQMEAVVRAGRTQDTSTSPPTVASQFSSSSWSSSDGSTVFGNGDAYSSCSSVTAMPDREVCDWSMALKGAGEVRGSSNVGVMLGARGCLISVSPVSVTNAVAEFYVVVVWQGISATADPVAGSPGALCASNVNFGTGLRRAVVTRVLIPTLTGP
jgi:type IV pilus assembly protein PilV